MAFENLNLNALFLRNLGLDYLYLPGGLPASAPAPEPDRPRKVEISRPVHAEPKPVAKTPAPAKVFEPLPLESWPEIWQSQFARAKPGKIAWTYWSLGADLAGNDQNDPAGRKQRSDFFRNIIRELSQPQGTHTFWPAALADKSGNYAVNADLFWSGVKLLGCRAVVILGSPAARPLLPGRKLQPLDEFRHFGQLVWILRDIEPLLKSGSWYQMTLAFLKNSIRNYFRTR